MEFKKIQARQLPQAGEGATPESRFWQKLKAPTLLRQFGAVTCIDFCPNAPYDFAVTSSTRITVYGSSSLTVKKTLSRGFKDVTYSGAFRSDGKLIVTGNEDSKVRVFDLASRTLLRQFRGHTSAVHVARFAADNVHVLSGGDDTTVRCWDLATQQQVLLLEGHTDYVRCGAVGGSTADASLWVTGGYDHTVRLWDAPRSNRCRSVLTHQDPVQAVLVHPSSTLIFAAAGSSVVVWDALMPGRTVHTLSNHHKHITSLAIHAPSARLLSGALDHLVKMYDLSSFAVSHSIKYSAPVLSVALSGDSRCLAVGMADGMLAVRKRQKQVAEGVEQAATKARMVTGSYRYFMRGAATKSAQRDFAVKRPHRRKLALHDRQLKAFHYADALDSVLKSSQRDLVAAMLRDLVLRGGLQMALASRDEAALMPLLHYLRRHIMFPAHQALLVHIFNALLDMYGEVLASSGAALELLQHIKKAVTTELAALQAMSSLKGSLQLLLAASANAAPEPER